MRRIGGTFALRQSLSHCESTLCSACYLETASEARFPGYRRGSSVATDQKRPAAGIRRLALHVSSDNQRGLLTRARCSLVRLRRMLYVAIETCCAWHSVLYRVIDSAVGSGEVTPGCPLRRTPRGRRPVKDRGAAEWRARSIVAVGTPLRLRERLRSPRE